MARGELYFGPVDSHALHVAIDMQCMFAEPGTFYCPNMRSIVPVVDKLASYRPESTVFTRFLAPELAALSGASWQAGYRQWVEDVLGVLDRKMFDLIAPLLKFVPPASVVDKSTYSAFESPMFLELLDRRQPDTLIFTGVKTNYCVLATVLASVDKHYRTIVVTDGVEGSSAETQRTVMETLFTRFEQQIELVSAENLLLEW